MPALYADAFPLTPVAATNGSGATPVSLGSSTKQFRLHNDGPNDVFWSTQSGVTAGAAGNGFPLANGETSPPIGKEPQTDLNLYFVCNAAETASVKILREA